MVEIRYSYKDARTIKAFSQSDAFVRGLMGPFGSGKSSGCVVEIVKRALVQAPGRDGVRRTRWAVIRNSYPQLRDTTIKTFTQWLPVHLFGDYRAQDHLYIIKAFEKTEIEILFRALDRPDHISNLLSLELTGAWVNEAREVPWAIIDALQGRVGRFPAVRDGGPTWHGVFMDTNPPDSDSRWYKFFEERKLDPAFAAIFKQPSGLASNAENLANLVGGRRYYENLSRDKADEWVKVYIKGEYGFVIDGRPIFPEFNDNLHCKECTSIKDWPIYRGWDWGLTPACVFLQMVPSGQLVVFDELCAEDMGAESFTDDVLQYSSEHYGGSEFIDIGDPAGEQRSQTDEKTCFQIARSKGIDIEPGLQSLSLRLESIRKPLNTLRSGRPGFVLHPRCTTLRKGFQGGYHYRRLQTSAERYSDKPDKNHYSHAMDALSYPCTRIFGEGLTTPKERPRDDDEDDEFIAHASRSAVTGY